MARQLRPCIRGGIYHVMNRGNRKSVIFVDPRDRGRFIRIISDSADEHGVEILSLTEMTTHFHMVVETPHGNISQFMQSLEGEFAQYFNWRHHHVGHLFQGTFKGVVIENDIHLITAIWYVLNNPLKGGLVERPQDWPWSTYAATAGLKPLPSYLSTTWLTRMFPADSLQGSQLLFRQCMEASDPVDAYVSVIDPTVSEATRSYVSERLRQMNEPFSYRELFRPPLNVLLPTGLPLGTRDDAIVEAHVVHGYTLAEIAFAIGLNASTVGKIFRRVRNSTSG